MANQSGLTINNITCIRQQQILFRDLNLQIHPGECLLIEGANGSGKTTLLKMLARLATPDSGNILWQGQDIQQYGHEYGAELHYVSHQQGIKLGLTIRENLRLAGLSDELVNNLLPVLHLAQHQHTLASALSAGQKRKLALLRLFVGSKKLWLLDEPLTTLDKFTQDWLLVNITAHLSQGGICVLSSHQPVDLKNPLQRLTLC